MARGFWKDRLPRRPIVFGALALAAAVLLRLVDPPLLQQARESVFDSYQRLEPRGWEPVPLKIVAIDDRALAAVGQWPWPRLQVARLVDRLAQAGAGAVAFDILLAEPDRASPREALAALAQVPGFADLSARVPLAPDSDALLAEALRQVPAVTAFALAARLGSPEPARKWGLVLRDSTGQGGPPEIPRFIGAVSSLPELEAVAAGNGFLNILPDEGGVVRRAHLLLGLNGALQPMLAAELVRIGLGATSYLVSTADGQVESLRLGPLVVPTDAEGALRLYFAGPRPERFLSAADLLDETRPLPDLEGALVLVGVTALGLAEYFPTPLGQGLSGVEIQAEAVEQMLLGTVLLRPDWADGAELLYLVLLGALLLALLGRLSAVTDALLGVVAAALAVGGSLALFLGEGLLLDPVGPSVAVLVVYLVATGTHYVNRERERRHIRHAFERYLAPAVVERLVARRDALELGGETRELTVLFSDIRGFTTISERLDAQALTSLVNGFMTPMTGAILEAGGTVDKYMGDAIMAFWNAPLDDPEHARHACAAALAMAGRMPAVNADLLARGVIAADGPPLAVGIGLNSGPACVGNLGSQQRFDYSAIGDAVNLASRLEGLCRLYGVPIVIGESTRAAVPEMAALELDLVRVKGKTRPQRVFALAGGGELAAEPAFRALEAALSDFWAAYRKAGFADAGRVLERIAATDAEGRLAHWRALFAGRIAAFEKEPPPPGWDGTWVALSK